MQQDFTTLLQTIRHDKLLQAHTTIIVAVSGGADSLALMHWLANHRTQLQITLHIATLDHGLRPEAADEVAFVTQHAEQWHLPVTSARVDTAHYAAQQQIGIEAAARQLRYDFLAEVAAQQAAQTVVTAHHADDQVETILMHMLRGTGNQGLIGMHPRAPLPGHPQLTVVRPLLSIRRATIEQYCRQNHLTPVLDPSNDDLRFLRNQCRHQILPRLRQINPQIETSLWQLAQITRTDQAFIAQMYQQQVQPHLEIDTTVRVPIALFADLHPALQAHTLRQALRHFATEPSYKQLQHALKVVQSRHVGALAQFANHVQLRLSYNTFYIERVAHPHIPSAYYLIDQAYDLPVPSQTTLDSWQLHIAEQALPNYDACLNVPLDAKITLRTRQAGDRIAPRGMKGQHRKLKKYLIDRKIPQEVRDQLPLVLCQQTIIAIILPDNWFLTEERINVKTPQRKIYFKVVEL